MAGGPRLCPRDRADMGEKDLLVRTGQRLDGGPQRQPFHSLDVVVELAQPRAGRTHQPELHDLELAFGEIRHRSEEFVHRDVVPGLLQYLALGGVARMLARLELALGQHPGLLPAQPHDGEVRPHVAAQHNTPGSENRGVAFCRIAHTQSYAGRMAAEQAGLGDNVGWDCHNCLNGQRPSHATSITILPKCWLAVMTPSASTMWSSLKVL